MSVLKFLQPRIRALTNGLFANWLPGNDVEVGDFGIVYKGQFQRLGSIDRYGGKFKIVDVDTNGGEFAYNVNLEFEDGGDFGVTQNVAGVIQTRITLQASAVGGFLYHLSGLQQRRPDNVLKFNEILARALLNPRFDRSKDMVVITEVQRADKATIIVSELETGTLGLVASGTLHGSAYLSGVNGQIGTSFSHGSFFSYLATTDTIPLIKLAIPKLVPPGGPGGGALAGAIRTFDELKDWIREMRIGVNSIRITADQSVADGVFVSFDGWTESFTLTFEAMSEAEMMSTMELIGVQEAAEEGDFKLEIEVQEVGYRTQTE